VLDLVHPVGPAGGVAARVGMQGAMKPLVRTVAMASLTGLSSELPERRGNCYAGRVLLLRIRQVVRRLRADPQGLVETALRTAAAAG
jgi:hypothetical protein